MIKKNTEGTLSERLTQLCPAACPVNMLKDCECGKYVAVVLNVLLLHYGSELAEITGDMCLRLTTCPECGGEDFTHVDDCGIFDLAQIKFCLLSPPDDVNPSTQDVPV